MGFATFGLQGILFGPLLVCVLSMVMTDGGEKSSIETEEEHIIFEEATERIVKEEIERTHQKFD